ncbi:ficolin-1-like [Asterias amurensis]|uniref:ficolin-1-like n=1 Tax=Asterias amurensis TaxID=7602 RepID=UPI003AB17498
MQNTVSAVSSEVQGLRRQLEDLQVSVSTLVEFLHVRLAPPNVCSENLARGELISGVYLVQPLDSGEAFQVYCDMETDGGGWTVFQRRQDGSVDFYLDFASYSRGFGNLEGEFWLGNDNLHRLTAQGEYELRVDLTSFDNVTGFAFYGSFSIADASDNYRLTVGSYNGTAGDALIAWHNNQAFSTKDRDNDAHAFNCAELYHGAWWYGYCYKSNLNARYFNDATTNSEGIKWYGFSGYRSLKTTEMKIRRKV